MVAPPAPSFTCGTSSITDLNNNSYNTVQIGSQCWTKQNLKVTKYNDGTDIPFNNTYTSGSVSTVWAGLTTGAYAIYDNESSTGPNATNYGFLYNWYAATNSGKLCPAGWHVPTDAEWTILTSHLGGLSGAGAKMKSTELNPTVIYGWFGGPPGSAGTNTSGFTGLPGGVRQAAGSYDSKNINAFFWSNKSNSLSHAEYRNLTLSTPDVISSSSPKADGLSIRCLKDVDGSNPTNNIN